MAGLVDRGREPASRPATATSAEEWNDDEWAWADALVRWAAQEATAAEPRSSALRAARQHREACLYGYRRQFGFVSLVLVRLRAQWQEKDVMMVGNVLSTHGRGPFTGERRIVLAMAGVRGVGA